MFFSPDGQWIGFEHDRRGLQKVAITGGASVTLCNAQDVGGASWGPDDTILFAGPEGILRVAGAGGTPELLIPTEEGDAARQPQFLPGGQAVLFTFASAGSTWNQAQIVVQSLNTGERRVLVEGGTDARYVPTGHLVYAHEGAVHAVAFDPERLIVMGGAVPLVENVAFRQKTGTSQFSVSRTGTYVYVPVGVAHSAGGLRTLVWVDREGREEPLPVDPRGYTYPRISPDGSKGFNPSYVPA